MRFALGLWLAACAPAPSNAPTASGPVPTAPAPLPAAPEGARAAQAFRAAESATGVPAGLLAAIAKAETGVEMLRLEPELPGMWSRCGVMGLPLQWADAAGALAGVGSSCDELDDNVLASATWLAAWARDAGIASDDLAAWAPLVARWAGLEDAPEAAAYHLHRVVYPALREGVLVEGVRLGKVDVLPDYPAPPAAPLRVDQPGVVDRPSPNFGERGVYTPQMVIIHTCEGSYTGCWNTLTDGTRGANNVSAHYVVNETGSEISQLVDEADRAWHIGATYDSDLNGAVRTDLDDVGCNTFTVGIEHAGSASQSSFPTGQIQASAELLCGITKRHGIPIDAQHVVGHGQLQPYNRTDPGGNWPWADYLQRARVACGATPPTPDPAPKGAIVIDSDEANNQAGQTSFQASAAWTSSTNVPSFWASEYKVAPTEAISDAARFRFQTEGVRCYGVQAWWTAASDRSATATFLGWDGQGNEVGRAKVDQRSRGGEWVPLGDWVFGPGWNEVLLSRWQSAGSWVIADAVRVVPSTTCAGDPCDWDADGDGTGDCDDDCPDDPDKTDPGACGCGEPEGSCDTFAGDSSDTGTDAQDPTDAPDETDVASDTGKPGTGTLGSCSTAPGSAGWLGLLLLALWRPRRR